jgi:hypothetical protein
MATTPQQVIDLVVSFERDLASFYDDLLLEPHLKPLENICRFMAQHSLIHAEMIANYRSDANIPQLQVTPLTTLHNRLKTSLRKEIAATETSMKRQTGCPGQRKLSAWRMQGLPSTMKRWPIPTGRFQANSNPWPMTNASIRITSAVSRRDLNRPMTIRRPAGIIDCVYRFSNRVRMASP